MPADFCLVAHSAEGERWNLRPSPCDGAASEVLPTPGGPQSRGGSLGVGIELADAEVFKDAVLDLGQPVVILVQHVFGLDDIKLILGHLFPRQFRQPVEIGAYDAGFRRVAVHRGEPLELLVGFFAHVGGKPCLFDGLGDVFQFLVGVGAVCPIPCGWP